MPKNLAMKPASLPTPRVSFPSTFLMSPISTGMHQSTHAEPLRLAGKKALRNCIQGTRFPRNLTLHKASLQEMCRAHPQHLRILLALILEAQLLQCAAGFPLPPGSFHSFRTSHAGPGAGLNRIEKRHLYERLDPVSSHLLS